MKYVVSYKKLGSVQKTNKTVYMRFKDKKVKKQFIDRLKSKGFEVKVFKSPF